MSPAFTTSFVAAALAVAADASTVSPLPAVPDERGFAGAFAGVHEGQLLAGGGANFPDGVMPWDGGKKVWHDRLFALDLSKPGTAWREIGKLPSANGYGVSLTVTEGVVVIGGGDATRNFREVFLMTLGKDGQASFRPLPALPEPLAQMAGAMVGRKIHLCGGITRPDATTASTEHLVFDLDQPDKGWARLAPLPAPGRILATAASTGDAFFVMAGCSLHADANGKPARTYLKDAWKFSHGEWTKLADLPRAAVAAASPAPVTGHSLFIVSGDDGPQPGLVSPADHKGFPKEILRYDTATDAWTKDGELEVPAPVTLAVAPWQDGTIFFNGEVRPGVRTTRVFLFHPSR